jgi:hypothetical protein
MTISQSRYATPPSVLEQITALPNLPMPDIKALWKRLFGSETPTHNRQFLERRIAYRLQEIEFRKVDRALVDRNKRRIQKIIDSGKNTKRDLQLMPGTVLIREYQGKEYRVLVTANGQYDYRGCSYRSLSRIAKEITGTAWSGLVFFGLKASSTTKKASKKGVHK